MPHNLPLINLPEVNGTYKVAQFATQNKNFLRFSKLEGEVFHRDIVTAFGEEIGERTIPSPTEGDSVIIFDNPNIAIRGMGKCVIARETRSLEFYGASGDYKIGIDREHLESLEPLNPDWNFIY